MSAATPTRSGSARGERWSLLLRNVVFTAIVPGLGGVYVPWRLLTRDGTAPHPVASYAVLVIVAGVVLYVSCLWQFGAVGRGTPGLWDAPRTVVAVGAYHWVRNPIYFSALLIVGGQAWLFHSLAVLVYTAVLAVAFHLFIVGYEEPHLRRRFGASYEAYRATVNRWIPRPPPRDRGGTAITRRI